MLLIKFTSWFIPGLLDNTIHQTANLLTIYPDWFCFWSPPLRYFNQKELQLSLKDTSYWESLHGKRRYLNSTLLNYSYINFDILEFVSLTYTKTWSTTTIFELECKCGNIKNKALEIKRVWHLKKKIWQFDKSDSMLDKKLIEWIQWS